MNEGRIVEEGPADQVCERPRDPYHPEASRRGADPRPAAGAGTSANCRVRLTLPLAPPIKPQLALTRKELPAGRGVGLRAEARRLPRDRLRRRRRRLHPVARRQSAGPLLPRAELPARALRARRRAGDPRRRGQPRVRRAAEPHPSRPSRGSPCSPRRSPPATSPSTCWREGDESLLETPFGQRRERLEALAVRRQRSRSARSAPIPEQAEEWLRRTEGTMAKQLDAPYVPGKRKGMAKVKREREIDCVVMGWRPGQGGGHGRLPDPRPLRRRRAALGRPHLRLQRRDQTRPANPARTAGDRRERHRRAEPLDRRRATSSGWRCGPSW